MVDMPTAVEIDEGLQRDLCCGIGRGGSRGELLGEVVVGVYIGLVMLSMVELHNLAGDGRLERAIVIYPDVRSQMKCLKTNGKEVRYMVALEG